MLSSLSAAVASDTDVQSLCDKVTKGLDKYLQDAEQLRDLKLIILMILLDLQIHH